MASSAFSLYFELGWRHIADWQAYDHMLFLLVLCAAYTIKDWRKLLGLVTAFTVGHAITLILAGLDTISFPQYWIELLIPFTISLTAIYNIATLNRKSQDGLMYIATLGFGLIHGLGFSNYFRSLLFPDQQQDLVWQLLAFNLGVEAGQLLIVAAIVGLNWLSFKITPIQRTTWTVLVSGIALCLATAMILERVTEIS